MHDKQREWIWRYPLQNGTHFGFMAVSLGYYETLMSCSASSTSSEMNALPERKSWPGIGEDVDWLYRNNIGAKVELAWECILQNLVFPIYFRRIKCVLSVWMINLYVGLVLMSCYVKVILLCIVFNYALQVIS